MSKEPVGVILLTEEPEMLIFKKWIGWLVVMVLFVMCVIYITNYFAADSCEGFILRQERSDYGAV